MFNWTVCVQCKIQWDGSIRVVPQKGRWGWPRGLRKVLLIPYSLLSSSTVLFSRPKILMWRSFGGLHCKEGPNWPYKDWKLLCFDRTVHKTKGPLIYCDRAGRGGTRESIFSWRCPPRHHLHQGCFLMLIGSIVIGPWWSGRVIMRFLESSVKSELGCATSEKCFRWQLSVCSYQLPHCIL